MFVCCLSSGAQGDLKNQVQVLRARVQELEQAAADPALALMTGKGSPAKKMSELTMDVKVAVPAPITAVQARSMDHHAIEAMRQQIMRLNDALKDKEEAIEKLNKELDLLSTGSGGGGGGGRKEAGGRDIGSSEAAQHTQEVARLTIDRLETNIKRKTDMVTKYQDQLREAREQYMQQKELDNTQIEQLREELAKKTQESIQNLRSRVQQQPAVMSGPSAVDAVKLCAHGSGWVHSAACSIASSAASVAVFRLRHAATRRRLTARTIAGCCFCREGSGDPGAQRRAAELEAQGPALSLCYTPKTGPLRERRV